MNAKSRMHCEARIDLRGLVPVLTEYHNCDWTTECDCEDGEEECKNKGGTAGMKYTLRPATKGRVELWLKANAWNPCSPSSAIGGEIDMQATFLMDLEARTLRMTAVIDSFPAFEAYATVNDGAGVEIFTRRPPKGNSVMSLPGGASTKVQGSELYAPGTGQFLRRLTAGLPSFTTLTGRIALHEAGRPA